MANQNALNDAYGLFAENGYNGSVDDFKELIKTEQEALQDSYTLFTGAGYTGSGDEYMTLLGLKDKPQKDAPVDESEDGASESEDTPLMSQGRTPKKKKKKENTILDNILEPFNYVKGKVEEVKKEGSKIIQKTVHGDNFDEEVFEHNYDLGQPVWRSKSENKAIKENDAYKNSRKAEKNWSPTTSFFSSTPRNVDNDMLVYGSTPNLQANSFQESLWTVKKGNFDPRDTNNNTKLAKDTTFYKQAGVWNEYTPAIENEDSRALRHDEMEMEDSSVDAALSARTLEADTENNPLLQLTNAIEDEHKKKVEKKEEEIPTKYGKWVPELDKEGNPVLNEDETPKMNFVPGELQETLDFAEKNKDKHAVGGNKMQNKLMEQGTDTRKVGKAIEAYNKDNNTNLTWKDLSTNKEFYDDVMNRYITDYAEKDLSAEKTKVVSAFIDADFEDNVNFIESFLASYHLDELVGVESKLKSKSQKEWKKEADALAKKYEPILKKAVDDITKVGGRIQTSMDIVKRENLWLTQNNPEEVLKKFQARKYHSQADINNANAEYQDFILEYQDRVKNLQNHLDIANGLREGIQPAIDSATALEVKVKDVGLVAGLAGKNYGEIFNALSRATSSTVEFVVGFDEFAQRMQHLIQIDPNDVPDWFQPAAELVNNITVNTLRVGGGMTGPGVVLDPALASRGADLLRDGMDNFSKRHRGLQVDYSNHDWATRTFMDMTEMAPQIAVGCTGLGTVGVLGSMMVSSAGNNFIRFEDEARGEYAKAHNMDPSDVDVNSKDFQEAMQMEIYSRALFHGSMEGISEGITGIFGSRALVKALGGGKVATYGFKKYLGKAIGLGTYVGVEGGIEGLSEGFNTFSTNAFDKYVYGKDVNLWEGVSESFYKGASVSIGFKSPLIMKQVFSPFIPTSTNQKLGQISDQLRDIDTKLLDPNLNEKQRSSLVRQAEALTKKSNEIYDDAITRSASIDPVDRQRLIDIEVETYNLKKEAQEIAEREDLTKEEKKAATAELANQYNEALREKNEICEEVKKLPTDKALKNWNAQVATIKQNAKMAEQEGAKPINIKEVDTQGMNDYFNTEDADQLTFTEAKRKAEVENFKDIINDPSSTQAEVDDAKAMMKLYNKMARGAINEKLAINKGDSRNYGVMVPQFNEKGDLVSYDMLLNKETSLEGGMFHTGAHEFIHTAFYNTLKQDPAAQRVLGEQLLDVIQNDKDVTYTKKGGEIFDRRMSIYGNNWGEEAFGVVSELIQDGEFSFKESGLNKVKGIWRRFAQDHLGYDIRFDTKEDVKNFIKDYNVSIKKNKPSPAIARMIAKGAEGNLVQGARDIKERQKQRDFSRAVQLQTNSNPDLMSDIDGFVKNPDGKPKHKNNDDFKLSNEFVEAYSKITQSTLLDGLIRQGMTEQGLPPEAMREFTQKVKEKLGERLLTNFNLDKNDSLFGWLTGTAGGAGKSIIYRAKGDVMKEYTKEQKGEQTSLDKPVGEAGTLADVLQAERSSRMEAFENLDLSAGRVDAFMDGPTPALDQLGLSETKAKVDNAIDKTQKNESTRVELEGLTYKGVKKLLIEAEKIFKGARSKRSKEEKLDADFQERIGKGKKPTKASDVVPTGPLYNVLKEVAQAIGVDPKRIIANQDLNAVQRKAAQQWLYSKIVKEDGTFDRYILEEVLPEGETRSGEATGIANTKLGSLYEKGDRAVYAEGATAAGKPTQTKRTDVSMEEMLDVVGINPDGSFQSGTASDGAIRQMILQITQLAANQGLRENALLNGTHSEAVIAQLGDGRALRAFSKPTALSVEGKWNELIQAVASTGLDVSQLNEAIEKTYGKNFKQKGAVLKQLQKDLKGFVELTPDVRESLVDVNMEVAPSTLTEHLQEAFEARQTELVLKNKLGFSGSVTDVFQSSEGLTKQRALITETAGAMVNDPKIGVIQAGKNIIAAAKGFSSAGLLGNGQQHTIDKLGGNVIPIKEVRRKGRQGYQSTENMADYLALANNANVDPRFRAPNGKWIQKSKAKGFTYEVYDGKNWVPINTKLLAENVDAGLKDRNHEAREKQSMDARATSKYILDFAWAKVKDKSSSFNKKDFAALMTQLGAGMESPLRRSANLTGIQQNIEDVIKRGKAAGKPMKYIVRYEHATSKQEINSRIIDSYTKNDVLNDNVWNGYEVNIISATLDNIMNAVGYKTKQPTEGNFSRMFNPRVIRHIFANINNIDLKDIGVIENINPKNRGKVGEFIGNDYVDAINRFVDIQNKGQEGQQILGKAFRSARMFSKPAKGISVLDFDDTLAFSNSEVISTSPDGTVRKLTAEQFAKEGADLLDQGWKHDFSEFNKVVDGKVASLFNKALKLQDKFGPENMFVLTARPAESANSIFEFLKANGLNIPLENITGLANSTPEAKALWIADKVGEGYNDFYFADDALQNVQAVKNMLDQFDVKSKVQQAKRQFSKNLNQDFNDLLEETTGLRSETRFSDAQAKIKGHRSKYKSIIPPSAQDFMGLLYNFIGKGKKGEQQMKILKEALVDPFARAINELNASRQSAANDFKNLLKKFPDIKKKLKNKIGDSNFTYDQAVRVYLWNKAGFDVPGLSKRDLDMLVKTVESDPNLMVFAETIGKISKKEDGYSKPGDYWLAENLTSDLLSDGAIGDKRADFLAEWQANVDEMFSPENLNKIEALYGSKFREALEDMLYRMKTGRNRPAGGGRLMNTYMNWLNNSVGAIMFFNMRSALLQTISMTNYVNWTDNNPAKAAAAFANQPQFWKDFARLFNSDFLKQRRAGNQRGINEAELSAAVAGAENKAKAAIAWLLKKGFLPTQLADSFAIASGGATFFRNRTKKYMKEGMTLEQAEKQAFLDFQETTEVSQQSARPDMISQQQASPLGRLILSFQNTPMQYARIMNKATRDLVNGRGDYKTHISKIAYYGVIQSLIFGGLQTALFAALGEDEEEDFDKKKERILNGMVDSWLTGIGYGGKAIGTVKNTIMEYLKQRDKGFRADHTYTILQLLGFSPPIGSKLRKVYSSIQTEQFNRDVFGKRGFTLDNPAWQGIGNVVEGVTNIPMGRMANKMLNIDNAMDASNDWWQRVALVLGWSTWDLGIKDKDIEAVKEEVKEERKVKKKKEQEVKKEKKKEEKEKENAAVIKENQERSKKDGICSAVNKHGKRCKNKAINGGFCTIHEKKEQTESGKKVQCKKVKSDKERCKMQTSNKSGYCYYHD